MVMKSLTRRYMTRVALSAVIYLISLFAANYLIERVGVSGPFAWALALVPGLAVAGMVWAVGMAIAEQTDEFLRMLMVRQVMIATGIALSLASIWGFLEMFALVEHVDAYAWVVVWCFGLGIGAVINRITHGVWGECW